jgi:type VI secretion system secreted protein Hcp
MAFNAYVSFKGEKQGTFKGSGRTKGNHAGKSVLTGACFGFSFSVQSPRDSIAGQPVGKRRHQPITIRKEVDAASPQLFSAVASREILAATIEIFEAGTGRLTPNYTAELSGGVISGIKRVPPAIKGQTHSGGQRTFEQEEISFTFQMIDVTWNDGGITMHDDWLSA